MAFLDDVDSIRAKIGFGTVRLPMLIGVGLFIILILVFCGLNLWNAFTTPGVEVTHEESSQTDEEDVRRSSIFVHVTGSVVAPGLYELDEGARVSQAIQAAGGFSEDALQDSVNLARELTDGEQVVVASQSTQADTEDADGSPQTSSSGVVGGKVNLNLASIEELMTLDGVGEATAGKIIAYREEHGSFASIDELKEVSGIGEKKFEAVKDAITV